jgi:hypothetical protein
MKKKNRILLFMVITALIVGVFGYSIYTYITIRSVIEKVELNFKIQYQGNWNGSYLYGETGNLRNVPVGGSGNESKTISFQGNINNGICFGVTIRKLDSSDSMLSLIHQFT